MIEELARISKRLYESPDLDTTRYKSFLKELEQLLNRYSIEKYSDTHDFLLAEYLSNCLKVFEIAVKKRDLLYRETRTRDLGAG